MAYLVAYGRLFVVIGIASVGVLADFVHDFWETESNDVRKGLYDAIDTPTCSITFDESVSCVFVVWKRYATSAEIRFIHENILHLLKKHGAFKVLGDDTALPGIHPEDRSWIIRDWMPRAMAAGLKFAASKSPESHVGQVSVRSVHSSVPAGLIVRSFDSLDDAKRWLQIAA